MESVLIRPFEYFAIRGHPRRFIVLPGHVVPEAERVVAEVDRHVVVEKSGVAGDLAEAIEPKRQPRTLGACAGSGRWKAWANDAHPPGWMPTLKPFAGDFVIPNRFLAFCWQA